MLSLHRCSNEKYPRHLSVDFRRVRVNATALRTALCRIAVWCGISCCGCHSPTVGLVRSTSCVQAKATTLKKYCDLFELNLRPELTAGEQAIAVAR